MADFFAGSPLPDQPHGPLLMLARGNAPPLFTGGENTLAPASADAEGRLRVAEGSPDDFDANYYSASSANAAVAITLAAPASERAWEIRGALVSYVGGTTTGKLTIAKGSGPTTVCEVDILTTGPQMIVFPSPRRGGAGEQLVVTLGAGGSGVTGKITLLGVRQVAAPGYPERLQGSLDFSDPNQSGLS